MSQTPILDLPLIQASQAQKHVTHNEALKILDAITQLTVLSADLTDPPVSPAEGERHIPAPGPTGDWAGHGGDIAIYANGAWGFFEARQGWRADIVGTGATLRFNGSTWQPQTPDFQNLSELGVNTTADATNRLAVAADATLLSHDGDDHRVKVNKAAAADTASLLFQTGFSGRAEMGMAGSDDFAIKVSPDGSTFYEAMTVAGATGRVSFPQGSDDMRERLQASRTYYVRTDGNDTNDGLTDSAGGALRTIQKAVDIMLSLDCGPHDVTLQIGNGTYTETVDIIGPVLGTGNYTLLGDSATPTNVSTSRITCLNGAAVTLDGMELTAGNALNVECRGWVRLDNIAFAGTGNAMLIRNAYVDCDGASLSIGENIVTIASLSYYGHLSAIDTEFDLAANIDWGNSSAFFLKGFCMLMLQDASFTGDTASTVGKRYLASYLSFINTAGEGTSFIPGDIAGVANTGSQYA